MTKQDQFLTTGEFASRAGISTSSVTKLIRQGKIKAEKKSGKWMISPDQLKSEAVQSSNKPAPTQKDNPAKAKAGKMFTVAEFAGMTYLTEFGVKEWLKQSRLTGQQATGGEWQVDAANLEIPNVKRLVR